MQNIQFNPKQMTVKVGKPVTWEKALNSREDTMPDKLTLKMDHPVAFCDARTVTPAEGRPFRYTGYVAGGRAFDALAIVAPGQPSTHTWYTFPEMTPDEVVAFRTYDTELVREGRTWFTPHSAFRDPDVELGRPARSSIELRVMCLYT